MFQFLSAFRKVHVMITFTLSIYLSIYLTYFILQIEMPRPRSYLLDLLGFAGSYFTLPYLSQLTFHFPAIKVLVHSQHPIHNHIHNYIHNYIRRVLAAA